MARPAATIRSIATTRPRRPSGIGGQTLPAWLRTSRRVEWTWGFLTGAGASPAPGSIPEDSSQGSQIAIGFVSPRLGAGGSPWAPPSRSSQINIGFVSPREFASPSPVRSGRARRSARRQSRPGFPLSCSENRGPHDCNQAIWPPAIFMGSGVPSEGHDDSFRHPSSRVPGGSETAHSHPTHFISECLTGPKSKREHPIAGARGSHGFTYSRGR
jgi:hypothetical protein